MYIHKYVCIYTCIYIRVALQDMTAATGGFQFGGGSALGGGGAGGGAGGAGGAKVNFTVQVPFDIGLVYACCKPQNPKL